MKGIKFVETKLIFNSYLAKRLLENGNPIVDLLKDHKRKDGTVFVFEVTEKFQNDFERLTAN